MNLITDPLIVSDKLISLVL